MIKKLSALLLVAAVLFTGCQGRGTQVDLVPKDAAQTLLEEVTFRDNLMIAEGDVANTYYNLNDTIADHAIYVSGSGATAEEIAVLKVKDKANLKAAQAIVEKRVENLKIQFEDYVPGEMVKLKNPVIVAKGDTVILVLADDSGQAATAVDSLFK